MGIEIYKSAQEIVKENRTAQEIIKQECESVGITDKKPFEVLARLLDSKKMTLDKYGEEHWEEDNLSQARAVEMTLRLKKLLDNKAEEVKDISVTHKISTEDIGRLESIASELKGLEERLRSDKSQRGKTIEVTDAVIA